VIGDVCTEKAAVVALVRTRPRLRGWAELLAEHGSATALLEELRGVDLGRPKLFNEEGPDMQALLDHASVDIARWEAAGIQVLTVLDRDYPRNLRRLRGRPPLLFVAGELRPRDARSVAVIGSRRASRAGVDAARRISAHLAACGYTVVSGLAAGVDAAAHQAALAAEGRTVAVIGTGLRRCYPPENVALQETIAREGAVVSRFWPDDPPTRRSFPARNAVMSGMALATVIVEAGAASGARLQARQALGQGRALFLLEPVLAQGWARELSSSPGTHVVRKPEEITEALRQLEAEAVPG
jgi:DNA processing protein